MEILIIKEKYDNEPVCAVALNRIGWKSSIEKSLESLYGSGRVEISNEFKLSDLTEPKKWYRVSTKHSSSIGDNFVAIDVMRIDVE